MENTRYQTNSTWYGKALWNKDREWRAAAHGKFLTYRGWRNLLGSTGAQMVTVGKHIESEETYRGGSHQAWRFWILLGLHLLLPLYH